MQDTPMADASKKRAANSNVQSDAKKQRATTLSPMQQTPVQTGQVQQNPVSLQPPSQHFMAPVQSTQHPQNAMPSQQSPQLSLAPTQNTTQAPTQPANPQVTFRMTEKGKIKYKAKDDQSTWGQHNYVTMDAKDFATYKNAGKRYESKKLSDLTDMKSYVKIGSQYYEHRKGGAAQQPVDSVKQAELEDRAKDNMILDRSRENRINGKVRPFDLGHYMKKPANSRMDVLSKKEEEVAFTANRDHVISGEALKRLAIKNKKDPNVSYDQGLTIAIPNNEMHKPHSPTFGGRQTSKDTIDDGTNKTTQGRVKNDVDNPGLAFYRDVSTMLDRTHMKDLGNGFDMSKQENRMKQHGAYRKLFKANVGMGTFKESDPAFTVTMEPNKKKTANIGTFKAVKDPGKTIGAQISQYLTGKL